MTEITRLPPGPRDPSLELRGSCCGDPRSRAPIRLHVGYRWPEWLEQQYNGEEEKDEP